MTTRTSKQKLYCFIDETGQDDRSQVFIVVAVISDSAQQELKEALLQMEQQTKLGAKKWHKSRKEEREAFLAKLVEAQIAAGGVFFGKYPKPIPFFLPMLETLSRAIQMVATEEYQAVVYVDGIDRKKSQELTNALRVKGIRTKHVRSVRDESEPLIRLADRWAGCIRAGVEGSTEAQALVQRALEIRYLLEV
jgi:Protein of unknown function (DUF3800)